jgi:hypothetical protein
MTESLDALKNQLAQYGADFCAHLFPEGRFRYGKFYVGDLQGNPGRSLVITVDGENGGLWKDFATGEGGSNLLELIHQRNGGADFPAAIAEAEAWLSGVGSDFVEKNPRPKKAPTAPKPVDCRGLKTGTAKDLRQLSELLQCSLAGVQLASDSFTLRFFDHPTNGRCWSELPVFSTPAYDVRFSSGCFSQLTCGAVRQDRRLDGKPFALADGAECKARTVGSPAYPVGYFPLRTNVVLCEGSSDFIAAHALIAAENLENKFSAVAVLGAGNAIATDAIREFADRSVLLFPDYDAAGIGGARRWAEELAVAAKTIRIFDYAGLEREDGRPIKDLRDFLRVNTDSFECYHEVQCPLGGFLIASQLH